MRPRCGRGAAEMRPRCGRGREKRAAAALQVSSLPSRRAGESAVPPLCAVRGCPRRDVPAVGERLKGRYGRELGRQPRRGWGAATTSPVTDASPLHLPPAPPALWSTGTSVPLVCREKARKACTALLTRPPRTAHPRHALACPLPPPAGEREASPRRLVPRRRPPLARPHARLRRGERVRRRGVGAGAGGGPAAQAPLAGGRFGRLVQPPRHPHRDEHGAVPGQGAAAHPHSDEVDSGARTASVGRVRERARESSK